MFKTKHTIISLFVALSTAIVPSVKANTSIMEQHESLWNDLQSVGVTIYVNDPASCKEGGFNGRYISSERRLDVCQDNYQPYTQVAWTPNDLDTLRHEAHHVLQDCNGKPWDAQLNKVFNPDELRELLQSSLTNEQINSIINTYRLNGASDEVIELELEAFSVARSVSAHIIGNKIVEYCEVTKY